MGQIVSTWTSVGTVHKVAYVRLFSANFDPLPLLHFVTHHGTPQSTSHISDPPDFSRPSTKNLDKSPLYKFSLNCSRGFLSRGFPVSTGILPHSLPEWAFRARPGLWQICLCPKVARIAEHKFGCR